MCGIAGSLTWEGPPNTDLVTRMCQYLRHRGPDDEGIVALKNIALGHRRLSIIDLSKNARQPMVCRQGRYYIVYNGEIYNFLSLRQELESLGAIFKSHSDAEVVLYAYIYWGTDCLNRFNGMFAFAIWDDYQRELFLARDRFGKKPLYYYIGSDKRVLFASELDAIFLDNSLSKKVSYRALNCFLALGYILSPMTIYEDVFKLEPATYLLISDSGSSIKKVRYWNYADKFRNKTKDNPEDAARYILYLLESSIKKRMISDVPIGAFLSGGIDSSSVANIMKRYQNGPLHTFSIGFQEESYNEVLNARRAAEWIGTIHHDEICSFNRDDNLIDAAIDVYDEPFADNSLIPTIAVSRLASSYVKVILTGDGADEIFAGYLTYVADKCYLYAQFLPKFIKKLVLVMSKNAPGLKNKKLNWIYKHKQFFYGTLHSFEKAHYLWRIIFHPEERVKILGVRYRDLVYDTDPFNIFKNYYQQVSDLHWLDKNLYVDGMTWLVDDILVKVDRATMYNSIEARCPYLDVDLVSYAASLPVNMKLNSFNTKYILKEAMRNTLPDFILNRPKSGFNAPTGSWLGYDEGDEFKAFNKYVFDRKIRNLYN